MTPVSASLDAGVDVHRNPVDAALLAARAFGEGRRLVVDAPTCPDHGHHVVVEFIHPVVAGARSLPCVFRSGATRSSDDLTLSIGHGEADLRISPTLGDAEIMRCYHVLWELVQVALEHPGLVGGAASAGGDSTDFLYPFLDAAETNEPELEAALSSSAEAKRRESVALAASTLTAQAHNIEDAVAAIRASLDAGGRVFAAGNGGSATDASRIVRLLEAGGIDAMSLASDYAVVSALANDLGAERVFARQLEALARPGDVFVACTTSGTSRNVLLGFEQADRMSVRGVGISGYGGGALVDAIGVDSCITVDSDSVHRIQEAQAAVIDVICAETSRPTSGSSPAST